MNVGEVLDTVEKSLLSRQLSSLERFILCQSWVGHGYSQMVPDCAYSIAHIKDVGSQLWQALSKALGKRVTKKNLFLVLKQYWLSLTGETVASDPLSVPLELIEVIDAPLTPTTDQLPVATDLVEPSYSEDSEQLPRKSDQVELVTEEDERLERGLQEYQTSCDRIETENNLKAPVTQSQLTIPSDRPPLDSSLYINHLPIAEIQKQNRQVTKSVNPKIQAVWTLDQLLVAGGVVGSISPTTIRRILSGHRLKPWRHHLWLSPKVPRDAAFAKSIQEISTLYTRPLSPNEMVLCVNEKTSLQPRPRTAKTLPAQPGVPVRVEHEYERQGALNLFAAFDTRTGFFWGQTYERKRQEEFIGFLEYLDRQIPSHITTIDLVLDNLSVYKGKKVQAWLTQHPGFVFYYPPIHCSWMNQVEQWFSILQRKRLRIALVTHIK